MSNIIFANSRIKSMENNLITGEKFNRMLDSSLIEATRILVEANYADMGESYEETLSIEGGKLMTLMKELNLNEPFIKCIISSSDYHNAKAFVKAKYTHTECPNAILIPEGYFTYDKLKESILTDTYCDLPSEMAGALVDIDEYFVNHSHSGRYIDVKIDNAMYRDFLMRLKGCAGENYYQLKLFFTNFISYIRARQNKMSEKEFLDQYIMGDDLQGTYLASYDKDIDFILEKLRYGKYHQYIEILSGNDISELERNTANVLLAKLREKRSDMFSIEAVASYYFAKKNELIMVRLVLTAIKNKADKSLILRRLRETYA